MHICQDIHPVPFFTFLEREQKQMFCKGLNVQTDPDRWMDACDPSGKDVLRKNVHGDPMKMVRKSVKK